MPRRWRRKRRTARLIGLWIISSSPDGTIGESEAGLAATRASGILFTSVITDPWIDKSQQDLTEQIPQNQQERPNQQNRHDQELVLGSKRFEQKLAHAGEVNHVFQQG